MGCGRVAEIVGRGGGGADGVAIVVSVGGCCVPEVVP